MGPKLTDRQWQMLRKLAEADNDGRWWKCGGWSRIACGRLVTLGFAEHRGEVDSGLASVYSISAAGRSFLQDEGTS